MLDIDFIRNNTDAVKEAAQHKNIEINIDHLLYLDDQRKELQQKGDKLREERNEIAEQLKDPEKRTDELKEKGKKIKEKISQIETDERALLSEYTDLMLRVPNLYSDDTPVGKDDSENVEIAKVGEPRKFNFEVKDHITLGESLDILDLNRGVKVGGFRGYFLKNEGAQLHFAVLHYAFNKLIEKGFTPFIPPTIVKEEALEYMGQFPLHKAETFKLTNAVDVDDEKKESRYLVGTSEVPLVSYYANEVLDKSQLPVKLCAFSQAYRSEVGSYGKDTKGIYRIHEFGKVEQVIICEADMESGLRLHEELRAISEEILQDLELPYRVLQICTGDMGQGKYRMYDLESWMPSRESYGETHSDSFLTDWQARRANIKYKDGNETKYAYTLNNTAIASPRILIALLENYQNEDGSITIPQVLRPYLNNQEKIEPKE